ncbi:MAG: alanine--tRNA ligase [Alphaproteobacteria bacterium]|jgi:alanyl-tRNA synthetase|nr:alanine--tRNA ligase [Alphaproteobacteria bacterium]
MTITVNQIRKTFLNYFEKNGHKIIPSSSLVPDNDPTLMFTNSGMVQFKNIFTGAETAPYKRATTSQKSVRAGGKHNDLDSVGYDVRHHTFFEMLGNFSFGDYFKEEAINYAWELVTKEFGLPKDRLAVTVFHTDEVSRNIWKKVSGLPEDRIIGIATKDNFWQMGDTGPCGYCSEIFYDHGPEVWGGLPGTPEEDGDRWIEIWNLVFDEFEDLPDGSRIPLKQKCIDTGMGLERISAILQGVHSNYDIDLFRNLTADIAKIAGTDPKGPLESSHNVIADHLRSMSFLIADGVLPSNEGRGYVLRRIMRRAMRHAYLLGVKEPMIYKLLPSLQREMGEAYPELYRAQNLISDTIKTEETRFLRTLDKGLRLLDDETKNLKEGDELSGATAFKLYDTYGFPLDLTQDALKAKNISVDTRGFDEAMEKQRAEARRNWAGSGDAGTDKIWFELQDKLGSTEFLGYNTLRADAEITALVQNGQEISETSAGEFYLLANQTPFYGEMGGQVGDIGTIVGDGFEIEVTDTKKKLDGLWVHVCKMLNGSVRKGTFASFRVNEENRHAIEANHTVTHLLHHALQEKFGASVTQKGSMVAADKMRFDIAYPKQISEPEIRDLENAVNRLIRANLPVHTNIMNQEDAIKAGAMALFGEKYGDEVRVVCVGDGVSMELCGGTHVKQTGSIGYFNIVSESAIAAGVRRLECVTGTAAEKFTQDIEDRLHRVGACLKAGFNDIENRVVQLLEEKKKLEAQIFDLKKKFVSNKAADNPDKFEAVNGVKFVAKIIENIPPKELKAFIDEIKAQSKDDTVVAFFSPAEGKVSVVIGVSDNIKDRLPATNLIKVVAPFVGAQGGGGRPDMAQTGGSDDTRLNEAIDALRKAI